MDNLSLEGKINFLKSHLRINDEFIYLFGVCMALCHLYYLMLANDIVDDINIKDNDLLNFLDDKVSNKDKSSFNEKIKTVYGDVAVKWVTESLIPVRNMLAHCVPKPNSENAFLYVNNEKQYSVDINLMKDFIDKGINMIGWLNIAKNNEKINPDKKGGTK